MPDERSPDDLLRRLPADAGRVVAGGQGRPGAGRVDRSDYSLRPGLVRSVVDEHRGPGLSQPAGDPGATPPEAPMTIAAPVRSSRSAMAGASLSAATDSGRSR